jgi:hypothetical protein
MVVTIDLENLASYEKYEGETDRRCEEKEIVEFAKNPAASWWRLFLFLSSEAEPERMKR